jgi:flagellar motor switch protein FliM
VSQTSQDEQQSPSDSDPADRSAADLSPIEASEQPLTVRRERRIRTLDFSQPNKFTADLRRRIDRVLNPFCEAQAARLSTELRAPVELTVGESSQLTWSAAKAQLPASSVAVALHVAPNDASEVSRPMLLSIELGMVLQTLECLLGGTAAGAPTERRLTEIDWALTRRMLDSLTRQLAVAWRDLGNMEISLGDVDMEADAGVVVPTGEPTFALSLDCKIDGLGSTMQLLIPWSTIAPAIDDVLGSGGSPENADPHEGRAVRRGLSGAHVLLRAEIGSVKMPVEQMLALTPGALLTLEDRAESGVSLFAEGVRLGRALPGLRGARRAIKLTSAMAPGSTEHASGAFARAEPSIGAADEAHAEDSEAPEATVDGLARMMGVQVSVWAELGRTKLPLGHALELPPGSVVELDQAADAAIELFVNGLAFAHGTLQVTAEGAWAVQVQQLL